LNTKFSKSKNGGEEEHSSRSWKKLHEDKPRKSMLAEGESLQAGPSWQEQVALCNLQH